MEKFKITTFNFGGVNCLFVELFILDSFLSGEGTIFATIL